MMKIPSVDYDNELEKCAYLGWRLSTYVAASSRRNTQDFLEVLEEKIDKVQESWAKIRAANEAWQKEQRQKGTL